MYYNGFKKDLQNKDIYKVMDRCKSVTLGDRLEQSWNEEVKKKRASLIWTLTKVFGKEYAIYGLIHFFFKTLIA